MTVKEIKLYTFTTVGFWVLVSGIGSVTSTCIAACYSEETFYAMPCSGLSYKWVRV